LILYIHTIQYDNYKNKSQYLESTIRNIERLIKLIEFNADDKEIDKLVNELIEMQNDILENPLDVHKAKPFYLK